VGKLGMGRREVRGKKGGEVERYQSQRNRDEMVLNCIEIGMRWYWIVLKKGMRRDHCILLYCNRGSEGSPRDSFNMMRGERGAEDWG
jgi:hypothetical protein